MPNRLFVHVEGQTEETFVNKVLRSHLTSYGYISVSARIVGNPRLRARRGGIRAWSTVREDIVRHLKEDKGAIATTMVDFYALPSTGNGAWPGRAAATGPGADQKGSIVEDRMHQDVVSTMGKSFNGKRFIPFVTVHEYEGLLFSDCDAFAHAIGRADLSGAFHAIRSQFTTPEEINDSPDTAPSKRILALERGYQKVLQGTQAAGQIGLSVIRNECPRFASWLTRLETMGST